MIPVFRGLLILLGIAQVHAGYYDDGSDGYITIEKTVTETCTKTVYKPPVTITRCVTLTKWIPAPASSKCRSPKCPAAVTLTKTVTDTTTVSNCARTVTSTTTVYGGTTTVTSTVASGTTTVTNAGSTTTFIDPGITTTISGPGTTVTDPIAGSTTTVYDAGSTTTTTLEEFNSTTTFVSPTTIFSYTSTPCYTLNVTETDISLTISTTTTFATTSIPPGPPGTGGVIGIAIGSALAGLAFAGLLAFCLPRRKPRPTTPPYGGGGEGGGAGAGGAEGGGYSAS